LTRVNRLSKSASHCGAEFRLRVVIPSRVRRRGISQKVGNQSAIVRSFVVCATQDDKRLNQSLRWNALAV